MSMEAWVVVTIGILGIAVTIFLFVFSRREKVKVRITGIDYKVDHTRAEIKVYWGGEFQRSGKKDVRYIKQILLKPDTEVYRKLCDYFKLPSDGLIRINEQLKLPKDSKVAPHQVEGPPHYPVYPALPELPRSAENRDKSQQMANELSQKTLKVGLVWEDTDKITWKTISEEDYGKWITI